MMIVVLLSLVFCSFSLSSFLSLNLWRKLDQNSLILEFEFELNENKRERFLENENPSFLKENDKGKSPVWNKKQKNLNPGHLSSTTRKRVHHILKQIFQKNKIKKTWILSRKKLIFFSSYHHFLLTWIYGIKQNQKWLRKTEKPNWLLLWLNINTEQTNELSSFHL